MNIEIGQRRRDGKFPVTLVFPGAPNAFGGFYPAKVYRKLYTAEKIRDTVARCGTPEQKARFGNIQ